MEYKSIKEIAKEWEVSPRRVQVLCNEGRVEGATKVGKMWIVSSEAKKPDQANKRWLISHNENAYKQDLLVRNEIKKKVPAIINFLSKHVETDSIRELVLLTVIRQVLSLIGQDNEQMSIKLYEFMKKGIKKPIISREQYELIENCKSMLSFDIKSLEESTNVVSWTYQYINKSLGDNKFQSTQFFTEEYMVHYLTDIYKDDLSEKVVDICCGGGNFLSYALIKKLNRVENLNKKAIFEETNKIYGYDLDSNIARIAYVNIILTALAYASDVGIVLEAKELDNLKPQILYSKKTTVLGSLNSLEEVVSLADGSEGIIEDYLYEADFLLTNPPFATVKGMDRELKDYLKKNFSKTNCDLCAAFFQKSFEYISDAGKVGIVVQNSWMFLDSLTIYRKNMLDTINIDYLVDLGASAFQDLNGEKSSVALIVANKKKRKNHTLRYFSCIGFPIEEKVEKVNRLTADKTPNWSEVKTEDILNNENYRFDFMNIGKLRKFYYMTSKYKEFGIPMQGTSTGDSKNLVDYFWRHFGEEEWILVSKGGGYCRWEGLNKFVLKWGKDGEYIKATKGSALRNISYFEETELVFSDTGTSGLNVRMLLPNQVFIASGPGIRIHYGNKYAHLAYLNSRIASYYIQMLTPKLTIAAGYIGKLPVSKSILNSTVLENLGKTCISLKEHSLIFRPNNFEYVPSGFIMTGKTLKENAIRLFKDDLFTYLQIMEAERKIDDFILQKLSLDLKDVKLLNSYIGESPFEYNNTTEFAHVAIDSTIDSLLDSACLLKRNKIRGIRYGSDNILEYMSRTYRIHPADMYHECIKQIEKCPKVIGKYESLLLHNAVLDALEFTVIKGFKKKKRKISDIVTLVTKLTKVEYDDCHNWIIESFTSIHRDIFNGDELLIINKVEGEINVNNEF
jgi:hypothetical protein